MAPTLEQIRYNLLHGQTKNKIIRFFSLNIFKTLQRY